MFYKDNRRFVFVFRFGGSLGKDDIDDMSILESVKSVWGFFEV